MEKIDKYEKILTKNYNTTVTEYQKFEQMGQLCDYRPPENKVHLELYYVRYKMGHYTKHSLILWNFD